MKSLRSILVAGTLALASLITATSGAKAVPVTYPITWNVSGTLEDGGALSGFFQINQYGYTNGTDWSLTTTAGSILSGYSYTPGINAFNPNVFTVRFTPNDQAYQVILQLTFLNSLLLPSSNNPLIGGKPGPSFECFGYICDTQGGQFLGVTRYFTAGQATTDAVPLPAALPLFASGLAGLGWLARRKKRMAAVAS